MLQFQKASPLSVSTFFRKYRGDTHSWSYGFWDASALFAVSGVGIEGTQKFGQASRTSSPTPDSSIFRGELVIKNNQGLI